MSVFACFDSKYVNVYCFYIIEICVILLLLKKAYPFKTVPVRFSLLWKVFTLHSVKLSRWSVKVHTKRVYKRYHWGKSHLQNPSLTTETFTRSIIHVLPGHQKVNSGPYNVSMSFFGLPLCHKIISIEVCTLNKNIDW